MRVRSLVGAYIVAWNDETDRKEQQRRVDATIARASVCHMSNAKWRKLFAVLRELNIWSLRWKFVRQDGAVSYSAPHKSGLLEDGFGDVMPYPYGPYREIEWVEIPAERATGLVEALARVGDFPVQQLDTGLRIAGYTW